MNVRKIFHSMLLALVVVHSSWAANTSAAAQLQRFSTEAGRPGDAQAGRQLFVNKHGSEWSCATCHGDPPTQAGRHANTGKTLEPLAPAFNPKSLTDTARVDKWFKRNCKDVFGRECSAGEKADLLAWFSSLK